MNDALILLEAKGIDYEVVPSSGNRIPILSQIDLSLTLGETLAILGPSGCGKTTLMRILMGLIPSTRGELYYRGVAVSGLLPQIGVVFQDYSLLPWFTVSQNIEMVLQALGLDKKTTQAIAKESIEKGGLSGYENALPKELSSGMQQRLNIARALAVKPEILFMDEPFAELDILSARSLRHDIMQLLLDKQAPVDSSIFITSNIEDAVFMANRILVMGINPGRIRTIVHNDLPFPRDPDSVPFQALEVQLHTVCSNALLPNISEKERESYWVHRMEPLPSVEIGDVIGLLKTIDESGGGLDIFQFSQKMNRAFVKVVSLVKAAEILDMIDTPHHRILLTDLGKEVVRATWKRKKEIFKTQLKGLSVVHSVLGLLERSEEKKLPKDILLEHLAILLPQEDPAKIFGTLLNWCQFAGLLSYDSSTQSVSTRI